jgi:hypothetical protein
MPSRDDERKFRNATLVLAAVDAIAALVQLRLALLSTLLVALVVLGASAVVVALIIHAPGPERFKDLLKSAIRIQLGALRWVLYALPGVAVTLLAFGAVRLSSGGSCDAPVDLRVLTAPENVTALTRAAARYVADRSGSGCRVAIVTVSAGSSIEDIKQGFTHGWGKPGGDRDHPGSPSERIGYLGPRPDIWIPDTRLAATGVSAFVSGYPPAEASGTSGGDVKAQLFVDPTIGTSPMVIGVTGDSFGYDSRQGPIAPSLAGLLDGLRQNHKITTLARPSPETSEAALVSTPSLYQALMRGPGWRASTDTEAEKIMDSGGLVAGDPAALLCRLRAQRPPAHVAVVVPENALVQYDNDDSIGNTCRGGGRPSPRLYPYYAADLPVLDHPFVRVRWPGEDSDARNHAVDDFESWLRSHPMGDEGFRTASGELPAKDDRLLSLVQGYDADAMPGRITPRLGGYVDGRPADLDGVLAAYANGRPQRSFSLLLDVSGSMAEPLAGGQSRLIRAQEIAQGVVGIARDGDPKSVGTFSDAAPVSLVLDPEGRDISRQAIQAARANGGDLALTDAMGQAAHAMKSTDPGNLVVVTDGETTSNNPDAGSEAAALHKHYPALHVQLVLTGPKTCEDEPIKTISHALGGHACVDGAAKPPDDTAALVMSRILWELT